jgi:signal transduction histidine kinase
MSSERSVKDVFGLYIGFTERAMGIEPTSEANQNSPVFDVQVEGATRDLHPILRDDIFRIAGEAMRNAFLHAGASRIEVEIHYDERQLRLRIRDDGKGIDSQIVTEKGRPGHWGLRGMHERAKHVGGNLGVWSKPDSGTEIELTIPASTAYATSTQRRSSLFRKGEVTSDYCCAYSVQPRHPPQPRAAK